MTDLPANVINHHEKVSVEARIIEVIEVVHKRGAGANGSPVRNVTAYFHLDGRKIAEEDPTPTEKAAT